MDVVAQIVVGQRSLRRRGFQRRVRIDKGGGGVKTGVGNAVYSDPAVIVRNVFQEPFDGVIRVGALVNVGRPFLVLDIRCHPLEIALRHEPASNILVDEDIAFFCECGVRTKRPETRRPIRAGAVRRAYHQDRILLGRVRWTVDRGVEFNAVAHGNLVFRFGVIGSVLARTLCDDNRGNPEKGNDDERACFGEHVSVYIRRGRLNFRSFHCSGGHRRCE